MKLSNSPLLYKIYTHNSTKGIITDSDANKSHKNIAQKLIAAKMSNAEFKANQYTHKIVKNIQQTAAKHNARAAKEINKLTKENAKISKKFEKLLSRNDPNVPASNKAKSAHPFKISHNEERPDEIKISRLIEKLIINKQTIDRWQNFSANNAQPFAKFDKYLNNINAADRKQFMQELGESQFTSSTLNSLFTKLQKIEQKNEGYHKAYITLSSSPVANHAANGLTTSHNAVGQAAIENGSRLGSLSRAERQASNNVNAAATLPNSVNARGVDEQKGVKAILMTTEQPFTTPLNSCAE